jgi:hypothetical protein
MDWADQWMLATATLQRRGGNEYPYLPGFRIKIPKFGWQAAKPYGLLAGSLSFSQH